MIRMALYIIFMNFGEYAVHRWPMHHRWGGTLYEHVTLHHAAFPPNKPDIRSRGERSEVFLPRYVVILIAELIGTIAWVLGDWTFAACGAVYYLAYECAHFAAHSRRLGYHHLTHHGYARCNYNITFPLFDWLLGTIKKKPPDFSSGQDT